MRLRFGPDWMLVLCTVIWGGTFPAVKLALDHFSPWNIVALRFAFAAILFAVIYRRQLPVATRRTVLRGAVLGICFFAGFSLQTQGLEYTSSSRSAFITELLVAFTPLFYILIYRRLPSLYTIAAIIVVLAGLFFLTSPGGEIEVNRGDLLTLGCALAFSAYIIGVGAWSTPETRGILSTVQCATVALLATPWLAGHTHELTQGGTGWLLLLYLALPGTVIVILLQMRYQPLTTPSRAGVIFALEPVFATVYAVALGLEVITWRTITGATIVTLGVVVSELGSLRQPAADTRNCT